MLGVFIYRIYKVDGIIESIFDECPQSEIDFFMPNYFCETHPQSPFIDGPHMYICPYNEHITISGRTFRKSDKNKLIEEFEICSNEQFCNLFKKYFGISINIRQAEQIF